MTASVAEILGLNEATPAPQISVGLDTAVFVAVPGVALKSNFARLVTPDAVVIPIITLSIKNLVAYTCPVGTVVSKVPNSTNTSLAPYLTVPPLVFTNVPIKL